MGDTIGSFSKLLQLDFIKNCTDLFGQFSGAVLTVSSHNVL